MQDDNQVFHEIETRKARYCRYIDTKQWDEFQELFLNEPYIRFMDTEGQTIHAFASLDDFVTTSARYLEGARTIHQVHNAEMERVSDREVNAIWSMEDYLVFPRVDQTRPASMHGYGHYHETWHLEGGEWRIARLELRRTILEIASKERVQ
ncbi:nuclear transport factor 2 family protein [Agrobacterium sp. Ap1]|uniref:nuclear transport factor 2 family protein n=1 Tax=Agrobacterium sp. Ap1 TaxID=2815337 RepID=UPI001A9009FF|nr:nuclear transport factor 2 family protein [Agrobacterium sp. Ap1]MBO0144594.1 nuclear transport factor 2 family protein [Agrobacterium sp. Ap1]